ncbi:hypothetical protein EVAR_85062_1 [Eumeta japonica]|uniref:Uncharacterized protein n=1 Tax=Eumeta variegata TaxID=151549 RepID=A0A4C1XCX3_EUMVA|nr:hypothetical protein EVAR_85062_1 [Eumeta japonica]
MLRSETRHASGEAPRKARAGGPNKLFTRIATRQSGRRWRSAPVYGRREDQWDTKATGEARVSRHPHGRNHIHLLNCAKKPTLVPFSGEREHKQRADNLHACAHLCPFECRVERKRCVRPLSLFYSDASADGVEERSRVPRSRSCARLRRNATMSHTFSCVEPAVIDL